MKKFESLTEAAKSAMQGDKDGFAQIYEETYKSKYYIALKYMKNTDDAKDVVADAYVKAWERISDLDDPEKIEAWLGQIVARTALDALRKKNPILFSSLGDDDETTKYLKIEDERDEIHPEISFTVKERQEILSEMIDTLPDEQRVCVLMYYVEEISVEDISQILECPKGTVLSRLNYARKHLKKKADLLEKKGYNFFGLTPVTVIIRLLAEDAAEFAGVPEGLAIGGLAAGSVASGLSGFLGTLGGKITLGVVGAVAVTGIAAGGVFLANRDGPASVGNTRLESSVNANDRSDEGPLDKSIQSSMTPDSEPRPVSDEEIPSLVHGGLDKTDLETILACVPDDLSGRELTKREISRIILNGIYYYEDNKLFGDRQERPRMKVDEANRILSAITDYRFTDKASSVPMIRVIGDELAIGDFRGNISEDELGWGKEGYGYIWKNVTIENTVIKGSEMVITYTREGVISKKIAEDEYNYYWETGEDIYSQRLEATMELIDDGKYRVRKVRSLGEIKSRQR